MSLVELFEEDNDDDLIKKTKVLRIKYLRRFILIHSFLYYKMDEPLVSDDVWQDRANELVNLQANVNNIDYYDKQFKDWDASSGYHFEYDNYTINLAVSLIRFKDKNG